MSGWKTWVAAAGSILWGVGGYLTGVHEVDVAVGFISGGLALVGLGHKIEKLGAKPAEPVDARTMADTK